jgi:hypothetical protein
VWEAHSEHGYQQAVRASQPHDLVVLHLAALNGFLLILAGLSTLEGFSWFCIFFAYAAAAVLRYHFVLGMRGRFTMLIQRLAKRLSLPMVAQPH